MKRFLHLFCLLIVAALLPAALLISRGLPADPYPYVEKKYAGWNGVLRAWVCTEWRCSGSFIRWLNACAADFEKRHDGVYIEFTPVDATALRAAGEDGIRPPELLLFSPAVLDDPSVLVRTDAPPAIRKELQRVGGGFAYPVAMGGYIWVHNRALTAGAPAAGDAWGVPADDAARSFSAAALALFSDPPEAKAPAEELPEADLDLGLPANADATPENGIASSDALERFIDGELPAVAVTQAELARLIQLRDAGRGPDWDCAAAGQAAYTDQLLLLGFVAQEDAEAGQRLALAREFGAGLLEPEAQAKLADIGAFSVTGARIYPDFSAYAALDGLLNGRELLAPSDPWSGLPDCAALLRALASGALEPSAALAQLRGALA